MEFLPASKDTAAGAVDDTCPGRWGERVIRVLYKPPRLSLLEYLFYAGDERFGALGVSVSEQIYLPRRLGPLPHLGEVSAIAKLFHSILAGEPVAPEQRRLIAPGVTLGGARPKALIELEGAPWIVKFAEPGDDVDTPLVEHSTMTLAARAGIRVAPTRAIALPRGGTRWRCSALTARGLIAATRCRPRSRCARPVPRWVIPSSPSCCAAGA